MNTHRRTTRDDVPGRTPARSGRRHPSTTCSRYSQSKLGQCVLAIRIWVVVRIWIFAKTDEQLANAALQFADASFLRLDECRPLFLVRCSSSRARSSPHSLVAVSAMVCTASRSCHTLRPCSSKWSFAATVSNSYRSSCTVSGGVGCVGRGDKSDDVGQRRPVIGFTACRGLGRCAAEVLADLIESIRRMPANYVVGIAANAQLACPLVKLATADEFSDCRMREMAASHSQNATSFEASARWTRAAICKYMASTRVWLSCRHRCRGDGAVRQRCYGTGLLALKCLFPFRLAE
jgi:hypothetical protein